MFSKWLGKLTQYRFLIEELVKRDFKKKYKGTVLGMLWSVLSPILTFFVMRVVFTQFFGAGIPHFTTYLFAGNMVFSFFSQSTAEGMTSLVNNVGIISKVNIPKYLFLLSSNVTSMINFLLTFLVFLIFALLDGITFQVSLFSLLFPVFFLLLFNIGVGLILSALYVFFRDMTYLYNVFTMILMYCSAIFYNVDAYPAKIQRLFLVNPIYVFIKYFRVAVINGNLPSVEFHLLIVFYAALAVGIGAWMYKKNNQRFMYYM